MNYIAPSTAPCCAPHPRPETRPDGEPLVRREIAFRASTFDALQAHKREVAHRMGAMPTNAHVIDGLLRKELLGGAA